MVCGQEENVRDDFDRCVLQSVLRVVHFYRHLDVENIDETHLCGQKWAHHGTRLSVLRWYSKSRYSLHFGVCCCVCFQRTEAGKAQSAARDAIWIARGNSISIEGSVFIWGTTSTKQGKWFLPLPPEYYLTPKERKWKIPNDWRFIIF